MTDSEYVYDVRYTVDGVTVYDVTNLTHEELTHLRPTVPGVAFHIVETRAKS